MKTNRKHASGEREFFEINKTTGIFEWEVEICPGFTWPMAGDLEEEALAALRREARRLGITPEAVVSRAFMRLFNRYAGQS
jgi:hypothetical protein